MAGTLREGGSANAGDVSNPFITKSAPMSPAKGSSTPMEDSMTLLQDGMKNISIASRGGASDLSATLVGKENGMTSGRERDRFVPSRPASVHNSSTTLPSLALEEDTSTMSDMTTASLSASLGIPTSNRRILSFRAAPPLASHATSHLDAQRNYLLHSTGAASRGTASTTSSTGRKRTISTVPERMLDAPGFVDDYYLNLIDWSCLNQVAIGLGPTPYVWDAETGSVSALGGEGNDDETPVTSVAWSSDGSYLAVGDDNGEVHIWDVDEGKRIRKMGGHNGRIPTMSWNGHVLSTGCRDGAIYHHDVRVVRHKVMELVAHNAEVCGLAWRGDGQLLASGGNDNVVNCWDGRIGQSVMQTGDGVPRGVPKWTKRNHTAAVKALAWCPWQSNLLATGGGTNDQKINFWSSTTGARTSTLETATQVTSLIWSPHAKELLSTHGFPNNNICVWSYPALSRICDLPAHDSRILSSAISPDGCQVATATADENLKFWNIWEIKAGKKGDGAERGGGEGLKAGMSIR